VDLDKIQGNVLPGFSKDYQAFVFVRFDDADSGRKLLDVIQPHIASGAEVAGFKSAFQSMRQRSPLPEEPDGGALVHLAATWVNVALSFAGLRLLTGRSAAAQFPATFRRNQPPGFDPTLLGGDVHALLIVGADRTDDLEAELERQRGQLRALGVTEVRALCGNTLPGDDRGHEHFGFKDAISQPHVAGTSWGIGPEVAPGEFVLGYPDETGRPSGATLPAWAQNGSFLAFVQLQQHVAAFRQMMRVSAESLGVAPADVAEWIVGRTTSGTLRPDTPTRTSHIGRAYSRWTPDAQRHRILRRGIPYGPPLAPDQPEDGHERGLHFLAYQSDCERQFEYVWTHWLNSGDFPLAAAGRDVLVGQVNAPGLETPGAWSAKVTRPVVAARSDVRGGMVSLRLSSFVTPRFGGYFFAPAIPNLSTLGLSR